MRDRRVDISMTAPEPFDDLFGDVEESDHHPLCPQHPDAAGEDAGDPCRCAKLNEEDKAMAADRRNKADVEG